MFLFNFLVFFNNCKGKYEANSEQILFLHIYLNIYKWYTYIHILLVTNIY